MAIKALEQQAHCLCSVITAISKEYICGLKRMIQKKRASVNLFDSEHRLSIYTHRHFKYKLRFMLQL